MGINPAAPSGCEVGGGDSLGDQRRPFDLLASMECIAGVDGNRLVDAVEMGGGEGLTVTTGGNLS